ncbi:hypothetical protein E2320_022242, partial [Naja naja]
PLLVEFSCGAHVGLSASVQTCSGCLEGVYFLRKRKKEIKSVIWELSLYRGKYKAHSLGKATNIL